MVTLGWGILPLLIWRRQRSQLDWVNLNTLGGISMNPLISPVALFCFPHYWPSITRDRELHPSGEFGRILAWATEWRGLFQTAICS